MAARERSSLMMASAGISHIMVSVHGPSKLRSNCPSLRRRSSYSGNWKRASHSRKAGSKICVRPAKLLPASQIISFLPKRSVRAWSSWARSSASSIASARRTELARLIRAKVALTLG